MTPNHEAPTSAGPTAGGAGRPSANYHTQALVRGLRVLEIVSRRRDATTLTDLHQESELPKSTLVRLLSALTDLDYLNRVDERPAYRLGHKVAGLSAAYLDSIDVADLVSDRMGEIAQTTRQTANLAVLDGAEVLHLAVLSPQRLLRFDAAVGGRAPAWRTGLGKALLASLPPEELVHHVPAEQWEPGPSQAIKGLDELREDLTRTRRRGYAVDDNEYTEGLTCLAVPIRVDDETVAALSVSGPSGEFTRNRRSEWVSLLQECAAEFGQDPAISRGLAAAGR